MKYKWRIGVVANSTWHLHHFWRHLLDYLREQGFFVVGFAPDGREREALESGHLHRFFPLTHLDPQGLNPAREVRLTHELYRLYRQADIDLVLPFTVKPVIYGSLAARVAGIPALPTITGLGYTFLHPSGRNRLVPFLYRWAFRKVQAVVFLNDDDAALFVARKIVRPGQVRLAPGAGIDTQFFSPAPTVEKPSFVFLFLGRLLLDKGIEELLTAFATLRSEDPTVECWIGGDAFPENPAAIAPKKWRLLAHQPGVKYLGMLDDVRPAIAQADVLILPSYREGLPQVVLEAMAMQKPVIATDTAGCRQAVDHGQTGWLAPVRSADQLAEAMREARHSSLDQRLEMGRKAREKAVRQFDQRLVQAAYLNVIRETLAYRSS